MKVVFCIPTMTRPYKACLDALAASVPLVEQAGWSHAMVTEIGCPYISGARATMLRKALDAGADVVVFIDHDLSWRPQDLLTLISTKGDVVAGLYRFKTPGEVRYMGVLDDNQDGSPKVRADGCIKATRVPAGFLKVTKEAVGRFMQHYPQLVYGEPYRPSVDLFNHGAHKGAWWGEDYAFSRNWTDMGGELWIAPDLSLDHHTSDECFPGNFHRFMCEQPGGSNHDHRA
jgi:glycosyltransferase involved in cell wall biosynthesis